MADCQNEIMAQAQAYQEAYQRAQNSSGMIAGQYLNHERARHDQRVTQAIYTLTEAKRIREDAMLMASIREWVRLKRDELAVVLDDIGV